MRRSTFSIATAALALTGGAVVVATGTTAATAGHANTVAEADLDGRNEVGSGKDNRITGDPNGTGEAYVFGIDEDGGAMTTLCYVLTVDGISDLELAPGAPRAAHIHEGQPGQNGPVVANLAWPQGGEAGDCLTDGEAGKFPVDPATGQPRSSVAEILANPGEYYVNVHNGEYPAGAIRGQLVQQ